MSLLLICYQTLNVYGRSAELLSGIANAFSIALADCTSEEIEAAFSRHLRESPDFPTPSCIIKKIKEAKTPTWVKAML